MHPPRIAYSAAFALVLGACGSDSALVESAQREPCDQGHQLQDGERCLLRVETLAVGSNHSCGIDSNGSLHCWGSRTAVGVGPGATTTRLPQPVESLGTVVAVSVGLVHTCAVGTGGEVMCWGDNEYGQLGDGTKQSSQVPVVVPGVTDAVGVAAGQRHTCAVERSGAVMCWGDNWGGQVGDTDIAESLVPVFVAGVSNAVHVGAGGHHSCALLESRELSCWGLGSEGRLGTETASQTKMPPAPVVGLRSVTQLSVGSDFTCALDESGMPYCWGDNEQGALGDGTFSDRGLPEPVAGEPTSVAIAAGLNYACLVTETGAVLCWGDNTDGKLGDGTTIDSPQPVEVRDLGQEARAVATGGFHTCARLADQTVRCWGMNGAGQLGDGSQDSSLVPVAVVVGE